MIKINEVTLDYEPRREILSKLPEYISPQGKREPEMSEFESAFLCGLLKTHKPKKILEVGVAGGGTTAIILQALEDLGSPYKMHSVDLRTAFYRDKKKSSGFLATIAIENNLLSPPPSTLCGNHTFHLGKYLPQVIDDIGGDIDFVILDTVHRFPGEVLDFPVMLPYLKDGAIVVLHDVSCNHGTPSFFNCYATAMVLCAVNASEKFINFNSEHPWRPYRYPNIAAFKIDSKTREHMENLFLSMVVTWDYIPNDKEIQIYREFYEKHYPADLVDIFNESVKMNVHSKSMAEKK